MALIALILARKKGWYRKIPFFLSLKRKRLIYILKTLVPLIFSKKKKKSWILKKSAFPHHREESLAALKMKFVHSMTRKEEENQTFKGMKLSEEKQKGEGSLSSKP